MVTRLAVLVSGSGTNLQAIIDAVAGGRLVASVAVVVSNKEPAYALTRAKQAGVPTVVLTRSPGEDRAAYDTRLAAILAPFEPDLIVLAGWMRILSMAFLQHYSRRVVNLHPALPGAFPGTDAIARAYEESRRTGLARTGAMVHFVPDEGVDDGPVIATAEVAIEPNDTLDTLTARVHEAEHELLVKALTMVIDGVSRPV